MLFSFSIIYHAYALLVPKVNTYFCIFCKNSPILIPGLILLLLVDFWTLGPKWASSILHTFYIVQLYTVALFFFWLILFLFGCWIFFLAIFSVFSMHIFLTIFCSLRTFFIIYVFEREIWELEGRNFSTKIFVSFWGKNSCWRKKNHLMMLKTGDFVIIYLFIFVVFKEKLDAYSQGVVVCRVVT